MNIPISPRDASDVQSGLGSSTAKSASPQSATSQQPGIASISNNTLLTITAVAAMLCLGASVVLIALSYSRRKLLQRQLEEQVQHQANPYKQPQGMVTVEDLDWCAEVQRAAIIRKSIAGRSESRPGSRDSNMSAGSGFDSISLSSHRGTASCEKPKTAWKDIEPGSGFLTPSTPKRKNHPTLPDLPPAAMTNSPASRGLGSPLPVLAITRADGPPPKIEDHPFMKSES